MPINEVVKLVGPPLEKFWHYSKSPGNHSYSERISRFEKGKVLEIIHDFNVD